MSEPLLRMDAVSIRLAHGAERPLLDEVSLAVDRGEVVGLVGESGSGKSVTARAVIGLLPQDAAVEGSITVEGLEVLTAGRRQLKDMRTTTTAMVFQDPRAGINPVRRIGDYLGEALRSSERVRGRAARARALDLLEAVGLPDPERHLHQYPHELSGGMLQRVMIAGALMGEPRLLLCDEPTTALDVTTQAEILDVLGRLQREHAMGMLFITHDLDLAAAVCDRVHVMYAGRVVEHAPAAALFAAPRHPYSAGLLASTPGVEREQDRLVPVRGTPLSLLENPAGCAFAARCEFVMDRVCTTARPPLRDLGARAVRCARTDVTAEVAASRHPVRSAS